MTCIVGMQRNGVVWLGADSLASNENIKYTSDSPKLVYFPGEGNNKALVIGFTTSWRLGQLLQYNLDVPEHYADDSDMEYIVADLIPVIRETFKEGGFLAQISNNGEVGREQGGSFIIAYNGILYEITADFSVIAPKEGYVAVGSGYLVATGAIAFHKINNPKAHPLKTLHKVLEATSKHNPFTAPPFIFAKVCKKDAIFYYDEEIEQE